MPAPNLDFDLDEDVLDDLHFLAKHAGKIEAAFSLAGQAPPGASFAETAEYVAQKANMPVADVKRALHTVHHITQARQQPLRPTSVAPEEEWLAERAKSSLLVLRDCVEVSPGKRGSVPVLRGTRFTIAQVFAEIAEGRSLPEIAADFGLDVELMKKLLESLAIQLDRPLTP